jgi:hypothetical protein
MIKNGIRISSFRVIAPVLWFSAPAVYFFIRKFIELPDCAFRITFGIPCPGCGVGHSLDYLLARDFSAAVGSYPAVIPLGLLYVSIGFGLILGKKSIFIKERTLLSLFFLALLAVLLHWFYTLAGI